MAENNFFFSFPYIETNTFLILSLVNLEERSLLTKTQALVSLVIIWISNIPQFYFCSTLDLWIYNLKPKSLQERLIRRNFPAKKLFVSLHRALWRLVSNSTKKNMMDKNVEENEHMNRNPFKIFNKNWNCRIRVLWLKYIRGVRCNIILSCKSFI